MLTVVQIVNRALRRLRVRPITALDENSEAAAWANDVYAQCRDECLQSHAWNFAMARAVLAEDTTAPAWGFARRFTLPADCLRVWRVDGEISGRAGPWRVEGGYLLTDDAAPLYISYITRVEDPAKFSPLFVSALTAYLAMEGAYPFTGSNGLASELRGQWREALSDAKRPDSQEGTPEEINPDTWITARQ